MDHIAELQKIRPVPSTILVYLDGEDGPRKLAVANTRKRWQRLEANLEALPPWRELHALDRAGASLLVLRAEVEHETAKGEGLTIREKELVTAINDAHKQAHAMFLGMFGTLLKSIEQTVQLNAAGSRQLAAQYEQLMLVQRETMRETMLAEGGGAGDNIGAVLGPLVQAVAAKAAKAAKAVPAPAKVKER